MTPHPITDPVFADRSGRRRRLVTLAGTAGGLALAAAVLVLTAAFTGAGPATLPGWGDATTTPRAGRPAQGATAAAPAEHRTSARRSPAPPATPPSPAAGPSTTPTPSAPATTATSSPPGKSRGKGADRRRVPTHTPSAHPAGKP